MPIHPKLVATTKKEKTYSYDAARTPWRIAIDYVWNGNAEAKSYVKKSSDFVRVNLGGSTNIKDGYNQNGSLSGQWHNATFVGAFACAAMGGENQSHLDASYTDLKSLNEPNSYFNQTLKTLYLFLLTGNFYLPQNTTLTTGDFDLENSKITVYPNPSSDKFTLITPEQSTITVISPDGKIISELKASTKNTEIQLVNEPSGVYLIQITSNTKSTVKKVIKK